MEGDYGVCFFFFSLSLARSPRYLALRQRVDNVKTSATGGENASRICITSSSRPSRVEGEYRYDDIDASLPDLEPARVDDTDNVPTSYDDDDELKVLSDVESDGEV